MILKLLLEMFKRFPVACTLILPVTWYYIGRETRSHLLEHYWSGTSAAQFLMIIAIPACCLDLAFRWRSEAGRPLKPLIQGICYGLLILWAILMTFFAGELRADDRYFIQTALYIPSILSMFIIPFWGDPDRKRLFRFTWRMLPSLLFAYLIPLIILYVCFIAMAIICPALGRPSESCVMMRRGVFGLFLLIFGTLWPLLCLARMPHANAVLEETSEGERPLKTAFRIIIALICLIECGRFVYNSLAILSQSSEHWLYFGVQNLSSIALAVLVLMSAKCCLQEQCHESADSEDA